MLKCENSKRMLLLFLVWNVLGAQAYIETVTTKGCEDCRVTLTCRHLTATIGILEAGFLGAENDSEERVPLVSQLRQALNKRCSGVNHCSFILREDCPGAEHWGNGTLRVKYVCVSEHHIHKFCNSEIILPEDGDPFASQGLIHNPGYPRFYSGSKECRWRIKASQQRKIKITMLDIAVIGYATCLDHFDIIDDGMVVHSLCMNQEPLFEYISSGETLDLALISTHSFVPLRGVLFHYTAIGCPPPVPPHGGYLVHNNSTMAVFRCCLGRIFEEGVKERIIFCRNTQWTRGSGKCVKSYVDYNHKLVLPVAEIKRKLQLDGMASDILAPALLIAALFLINFIILFFIYRIKKKQALEIGEEELTNLSALNTEKV